MADSQRAETCKLMRQKLNVISFDFDKGQSANKGYNESTQKIVVNYKGRRNSTQIVDSYNKTRNSGSKSTKKFMQVDFDATQPKNNQQIKSHRDSQRISTEPQDGKIYKIISKEIVDATLKKKLQTQPTEKAIKLNFRVGNGSHSKEKQKVTSQRKRNIQELVFRQVEQAQRQNECRDCIKNRNALLLMRDELEKIISQQKAWRQGKKKTDQVLLALRSKECGLGQNGDFGRQDRQLLESIRVRFNQLIREVDSLSMVEEETLQELSYLSGSSKEGFIDKFDDFAELKVWFEELREHYSGEITPFHAQENHRSSEIAMLQRKIKKISCKLKYYLKENINLQMANQLQSMGEKCVSSADLAEIIDVAILIFKKRREEGYPNTKSRLKPTREIKVKMC